MTKKRILQFNEDLNAEMKFKEVKKENDKKKQKEVSSNGKNSQSNDPRP